MEVGNDSCSPICISDSDDDTTEQNTYTTAPVTSHTTAPVQCSKLVKIVLGPPGRHSRKVAGPNLKLPAPILYTT